MSEIQRVRWLKWDDVAARSVVLVGLLFFFSIFAAAVDALVRALIEV